MVLIGKILVGILWGLLGLLGLVLLLLLAALLIPVRVWLRYDAAGFAVRLQVLFFRLQLLPQREKPVPKAKAPRRKEKKKTKKEQPVADAGAGEKNVSRSPAGDDPMTERPTEDSGTDGKPKADKKAEAPPQSEAHRADAAASGSDAAKKKQQAVAPKKTKKDADPMVRRILESLPELLGMAGNFFGTVLRSLRFSHLRIIVPVSGGEPDAVARRVGKANAWFYAIVSPLENALHLRWEQVRVFPDYKEEHADALELAGCVRGQLLPVAIAAVRLLIGLKKENIL